jgi:hypothetical protein
MDILEILIWLFREFMCGKQWDDMLMGDILTK